MPGELVYEKRSFCYQDVRHIRCRNGKKMAYFNVEATPPRRMMSVCSVNATSLARGYSLVLLGFNGSVGLGVTKKVRPAGD